MLTLFHHPFCPHSRFIRLAVAEHGVEVRLVEERPWARREEFLVMNPAGTTPVLVTDGAPAIPGASVICEFLDETLGREKDGHRLLAQDINDRIEVRRLLSWFNDKFFRKSQDRWSSSGSTSDSWRPSDGGGPPDTESIRAAKANVRYHLQYIGWLVGTRNFLAGERLTYADLAAAAHLSAIDYLGDVPWNEDEAAKAWYARIKSRPSFRPLLAEWLAGVPASPSYVDLDF